MHEVVLMKIFDGFADVPEVSPDQLLIELSVAILYLLIQAASRGKLEHHVRGILLLLVVVVDQLDNVGVVELVVHVYFLFGVFVVDLSIIISTIFIATTSLFSVFRANFTYPYDPKPTISTFPTSFFKN